MINIQMVKPEIFEGGLLAENKKTELFHHFSHFFNGRKKKEIY